jgi:response regulator RpfG family c-di-GMP phosphodiesterase
MTEFAHMRLLVLTQDSATRERAFDLLANAGYSEVSGGSDVRALPELCAATRPDLVLIDLRFGDAAFEALGAIHGMTDGPRGTPVLVLEDDGSADARHRALSLGVHDFVPVSAVETDLLVRVRNALRTRRLQQHLEDRDTILGDALRERMSELETSRESLSVLAGIAEYHDDDTYQHAQRVGIGASLIAQALELPEPFVTMIRDAAPLHDIGKVGISRRILLKPDRLTPAEWMHMMRHVEMGAKILDTAKSPVLRLASEIALTHHERWDGNGYLAGLSGEDIPISGRITALADVWDTLTHARPYKPAWDEERALAEIHGQSGIHFDPRVVEAFSTIDWQDLNAILSSELAQLSA